MFLKWFYILTGIYLLGYGGMIIYDLFGGNFKKKSSKVDTFTNTDSGLPDPGEEESTVVAETDMQSGQYDIYDPQINPYNPEPGFITGSIDISSLSQDEKESNDPVVSAGDPEEAEGSDGSDVDSGMSQQQDYEEIEQQMTDIDVMWQEVLTSAAMESALSVNSPRRSLYTTEILSI